MNQQITLTEEQATEYMERAVAEKGEHYVYEGPSGAGLACLYVHRGEPSCIVGHVLSYAGADAEFLDRCDGAGSPTGLLNEGLLSAPEEVIEALVEAQEAQDNGAPWGDALGRYHGILRAMSRKEEQG